MTLSGGNLSRILHVTGDGTDALMRDLTLDQGRTPGDDFDGGGAILGNGGTSLLLDQATVHGNYTTNYIWSWRRNQR